LSSFTSASRCAAILADAAHAVACSVERMFE
jgi:hypothetical protein